mmetsp:Transcript_25487/g.42533  ORF Transcript_25487/g.42533 Transcript_25487/m.42533 type:complete len:363 (-) Transcript_25487:629-1717(-)
MSAGLQPISSSCDTVSILATLFFILDFNKPANISSVSVWPFNAACNTQSFPSPSVFKMLIFLIKSDIYVLKVGSKPRISSVTLWLLQQALCKGVCPRSSSTSRFALLFTSSLNASAWPTSQAACTAVMPVLTFLAFTSTPSGRILFSMLRSSATAALAVADTSKKPASSSEMGSRGATSTSSPPVSSALLCVSGGARRYCNTGKWLCLAASMKAFRPSALRAFMLKPQSRLLRTRSMLPAAAAIVSNVSPVPSSTLSREYSSSEARPMKMSSTLAVFPLLACKYNSTLSSSAWFSSASLTAAASAAFCASNASSRSRASFTSTRFRFTAIFAINLRIMHWITVTYRNINLCSRLSRIRLTRR